MIKEALMLVRCFAIGQSKIASPGVKPAAQRGRRRQDQTSPRFQQPSRFMESCAWNLEMFQQSRHHHGVKGSIWQRNLADSDIAQQELGLHTPASKSCLESREALRAAVEQSYRVHVRRKVIQKLAVATTSIENVAAQVFRYPGKPC